MDFPHPDSASVPPDDDRPRRWRRLRNRLEVSETSDGEDDLTVSDQGATIERGDEITFDEVRDTLIEAEDEWRQKQKPEGLPEPLELGPQATPPDPGFWVPRETSGAALATDDRYNDALDLVGDLDSPSELAAEGR